MQQVIASRDVDVLLNFDAIGVPLKLQTGATVSVDVSGTTDDIGAISTDEPIATDNGGNTYDIQLSLQTAEAQRIKDALAAATSALPDGAIAHIRQIVEAASISIVWHKRRDVPATSTIETYLKCTGVEEGTSVERRSTETLQSWRFRARAMARQSIPLL